MKLNKARQSGVISIETAFLLPVVLAVMMMFFDVTRLHLQYSLLDSAMRQTLRELLAENWREKTLSSGVVSRMVEPRGYGFFDSVNIELRRYESMEALLSVEKDPNEQTGFQRAADPVFRVTATLTTELKFSPLAYFEPEPLVYTSSLIISQNQLFD